MEDVHLLDKNLATVGLDVGTNQGDNDATRPLGGHAWFPTAPFKAKHWNKYKHHARNS